MPGSLNWSRLLRETVLFKNHESIVAIMRSRIQFHSDGKFLEYSGITHASSAKKAVTRLADLKIIYEYKKEYHFNSPFFRTWLIYKKY